MKEPFDIEITMMYALTEPWPRAQGSVGEGLCSDGAAFTVTLMLYGEAALSVVRTQVYQRSGQDHSDIRSYLEGDCVAEEAVCPSG
jgi:hypothetical protein